MTNQTNSYDKIINLWVVLFDKDYYSNRGMEIKYGNITINGIIRVSKIKVPQVFDTFFYFFTTSKAAFACRVA